MGGDEWDGALWRAWRFRGRTKAACPRLEAELPQEPPCAHVNRPSPGALEPVRVILEAEGVKAHG